MGVNSIFLGKIGITLLFTTSLGVAQANQCTKDLSACYEAAEEGVAEAQFYLGLKYAQEKSYTKAVQWYRKAAEQGITEAQYNLAMLYLEGEGVVQSDSEGRKWLQKAANTGDKGAIKFLKSLDSNPCATTARCIQAAKKGNADAQLRLAAMYHQGYNVVQSDKESAKWLRKAANNGLVGAQYDLGITYLKGLGVPRSEKKAYHWFLKAAKQGSDTAEFKVAMFYIQGKVVKEDYDKALVWLRRSASKGNQDAKLKISQIKEYKQAKAQSDRQVANNRGNNRVSSKTNWIGKKGYGWSIQTEQIFSDGVRFYYPYCENSVRGFETPTITFNEFHSGIYRATHPIRNYRFSSLEAAANAECAYFRRD